MKRRKIVIANQAANYLTVGLCNEFAKESGEVVLMTGSAQCQGEKLDPRIGIRIITKLMAFGIPPLYIAPPDSPLWIYAKRFGHATDFMERYLERAVEFIDALTRDANLYRQMVEKSLSAAESFKCANARKSAEHYLEASLTKA